MIYNNQWISLNKDMLTWLNIQTGSPYSSTWSALTVPSLPLGSTTTNSPIYDVSTFDGIRVSISSLDTTDYRGTADCFNLLYQHSQQQDYLKFLQDSSNIYLYILHIILYYILILLIYLHVIKSCYHNWLQISISMIMK